MLKESLAIAGLAVMMLVGAPAAWAQGGGGGGTGGGGTGGGGTGGAGGAGGAGGPTGPSTGGTAGPSRPTIGVPSQPRQEMPQFETQRPIYFSGKVITEDGSPPPDHVVIEMVCNGQPRPQAYTDLKGKFSFQLGQNQGMFSDASYSGIDGPDGGFPGMPRTSSRTAGGGGMTPGSGYSPRDLMGCELRAVLAGYVADPVQLSGRRALDNPDVGTIILKRLSNVEGFTFSATTGMAPKDAKKAYEKGMDLAKKKKLPEAQAQFQKAVDVYPKYAIAWFELGRVQEAQNSPDSRKSYEEAIKADSRFVKPYLMLAGQDAREKKWDELAHNTDQIIKLDPYSFPGMYFYNAVAHYNLQHNDRAEKSAREAVKLDTGHKIPKANHLLGIILAQKKDYTGAAENLKTYLMAAPSAPDADNVRKQLAEIERVMGASAAAPGTSPPATPPNQ